MLDQTEAQRREARRKKNRKAFRCSNCGERSIRNRDHKSGRWDRCPQCNARSSPVRGKPRPPLNRKVAEQLPRGWYAKALKKSKEEPRS